MNKLIETGFPFSQLSLIAERESWRKEIYRPVYYLHKWWARRLGSVFRGIILAACLDSTEDFWLNYYSKNAFNKKIVFDPFMGSGVSVGEALKLGCRAIGRDINPVAYLSTSAALSKYSSVEVLSAFRKLEKDIAPKLLSYFDTISKNGEKATVLYYFLVKIIICPKCNKKIDLFTTRIFSKNAVTRKDPSAKCLCPGCGEINHTTFDSNSVNCPNCNLTYNPQQGNIKGQYVKCNHCQYKFRLVERMSELEKPLGFRRYAKLILSADGRKKYETLNSFDKAIEAKIAKEFKEMVDDFPCEVIAPGYNTNQMIKHNYQYWHQLFSDRQLVCIKQLVNSIKMINDDSLRLLFACLLSGTLEFNNLFTSFKGEGTGAVRHMFANHILKPEMMPLEANIWGTNKSSGAFACLFNSRIKRALSYKSDPFELSLNDSKSTKVYGINPPLSHNIAKDFKNFNSETNAIYLSSGDSSCTDLPDKSVDLVVTDPPFFDNVHYSELADFFYYWLNQIMDLSSKTTTRASAEVQDKNVDQFTKKLTSVFAESCRVLRSNGLFIFTYHHSRHEGWTAVHRAIRHAGFACIQSYPIKAEMSVSMPLQQAKSPIHLDLILVCRKDTKINNTKHTRSPVIRNVIKGAKKQASALKGAGIKISLGDAKVILMGRLLCEIHTLRQLHKEECYLINIESDIDSYVSQVASTPKAAFYNQANHEPVQLSLFEEIADYFNKKSGPL